MTLPQRVPRRRRHTARSLQAAARVMPTDEQRYAPESPWNQGGFAWQARAWHVVKHLGLVHYGMDFIKDNAAQLEYFVAEAPDDPEEEAQPLDFDHPAAVELERLSQGPYGGVSDLIAQLVIHEEAAGEGYLSVRYEREGEAVSPPTVDRFAEPPDDYEEVWEVLTPQTKKRRENDPTMKPVQSVRIWKPDPERPEWPDSSLRSVLPECEQLLLIQQHVTGTLQSRLHSGILLVPEELDPSPPAPPDEGDDEMGPLMRDIFKVFSSPIANPDAAAAVMPYLLMGKADLLKEVRHIDLSREFDDHLLEVATHLKITIAGGMDLPAERLLGMGNSNHWNVWYLDESTYVQHLKPDIELVIDGLLRAWLRPAWEAAGLDPDDYVVVADPTKLTMMSAAGQPGGGSADEIGKRITAAGVLIRSGFDPEASLVAVGLPEVPHTGLLPTSVKDVTQVETSEEVNVEEVEETPDEEESVQAAATAEELGEALADIDDRVLADLMALIDDAVAEQTDEAESRLLEAMALAGISVDTEPLAQALADANISPAEIVPDEAFESIIEPTAARLADALAEAGDVIQAATGATVTATGDEVGNIAGGVAGLAVALADWLRSRWFTERPAADEAVAYFARHGADLRPPGGLIMDAMTEAGGGLGQVPGSRGVANAQTVEGWLLESGLAVVGYRWVYGMPAESFRPHLRLSGVEFTSATDERIANTANRWPHNEYWRPGDHRGCQCRWAKILLPAVVVQAA